MKPRVPSESDFQILAELGRYRILTIEHILRLKLPGATDRKHVGERLSFMVKTGCVERARGSATTPYVHWLTPKAAKHYGEHFPPEWARAISSRGFAIGPHMRQRLDVVDVCIAARAWADREGGRIESLRTDFEASDALQRATTLEAKGLRYTPDALTDLVDGAGTPWTFALEMENGGFQNRLENFSARLPERLEVMKLQVIDHALQRPRDGRRAARMLFVFSSAELLSLALEKARRSRPEDKAWTSIYLQALPAVIEDFGGDWFRSTGERGFPFTASQ